MLSKMAKKTVAVFSILLLFLGLLPSVNANLDKHDADGIAYDNFDDITDVTLVNCTNESGSIMLKNESTNTTYDYSNTPNKIEGWAYRETLANPGEDGIVGFLGRFVSPTLIPYSEEFEATDYNNIKAEGDGLWVETQSVYGWIIDHTYYPMNRFKFQINQTKDSVKDLKIHWKSGEFNDIANLKNISMYLWSFGDIIPRWEYFNGTSESNGSIDVEDGSNKFISNDGEIEILIIGTPKDDGDENTCTLYSDYIEVKITTTEGHLPAGTAISSVIEPGASFSGWESIIWERSEPTDTCYIKLQVLDSYENIIDDNLLDGNSNGFTDSPIDLSSLGSIYSKIRLKATLYSTNLQFTPCLYSWGVLWHTSGGFHDSFVFDFRISKTYSVETESGDAKISNYISNWPIFGKDPANTRAYIGPEAGVGSNKTYWFTHRDIDVGGWFRSPIMNNGRVYIGSNDDKIYAFNLTAASVGDPQNPVDVSGVEYKVETSIAANDDIVIVATSKLDSVTNKIYALNSTDLSDVKWSYPDDDYDDPICFSASPTISDGKVFVTSWSGQFSNTPLVSSLFNRLNSILGYKLGLNNKLIALDLNSGHETWAIDLPAGSFSTPAVSDGLIFVGCENSQGKSLFAFNENTGEEAWNASVGAIGRASPVVTESDAGKVVIVLSREQSLLSYKGTDKVFALNAETGEILWNKTIGNQSSLLRAILLKSIDFEHTMAVSPPGATPAAFGDSIFVMSSNGKLYALNINNGEEKWTFDLTKESESTSSSYFTASPIVVHNEVYVTSPGGYIYILDTSSGELARSIYPFEYSDYRIPPPTYVYASPIITNGLILLSSIEWNPVASTTVGRVFCIGNYTNNSFGKIYSVPIHVQKGRWWSSFNANHYNTTENTVTFSILDGNGNIVKSDLNGTNNNISDLKSGVIQLCANLTINNESQAPPILYDWEVYWNTIEASAPVLVRSSFRPSPDGWIRNNTPICTIDAYDNTSGLDVSSARFRITNTSNVKSGWYVADCSGENGTRDNQVATADISKLDLDPNASDLKSIEFSIKDLAGNKATFDLGKNFSIDRLAPTSEIVTALSGCYTESVHIEAEGTDPGDATNRSGINNIALYYRLEGEENWTLYNSSKEGLPLLFENDTSGVYEVCTIATDNAGNIEAFPNETEETLTSFTYDNNDPYKPEFKDLYSFKTIPEFTIEFKDDYNLKTVEYKLNFQSTWTTIKDDINSKTYTGTWSLTKEDFETMADEKTYYMYFRLIDACGNQYETPATPSNEEALNISVNTIPPGSNVSLDLSDLQGGGWKDTYIITADVPHDDDITGVTLEYSYSSDHTEWSEWAQYGDNLTEGPYTWEFKSEEGSGYYKFKTKIWAEGYFNESPVREVNLAQFPAALVALMIILFVILLVITILLVKRMRKKKE